MKAVNDNERFDKKNRIGFSIGQSINYCSFILIMHSHQLQPVFIRNHPQIVFIYH